MPGRANPTCRLAWQASACQSFYLALALLRSLRDPAPSCRQPHAGRVTLPGGAAPAQRQLHAGDKGSARWNAAVTPSQANDSHMDGGVGTAHAMMGVLHIERTSPMPEDAAMGPNWRPTKGRRIRRIEHKQLAIELQPACTPSRHWPNLSVDRSCDGPRYVVYASRHPSMHSHGGALERRDAGRHVPRCLANARTFAG